MATYGVHHLGLHHVAIKVESEQDLMNVFDKVTNHPGVTVEFAPELLHQGPAKHFMVYEPSGIRMEFIWAPQ